MAALALMSPVVAVCLLLVLHRFEQWMLVESDPAQPPDALP
jgi:hypothetical protein